MKSIILAIIGASLYGTSSVVINEKLNHINALTIIICYFPIVIILSIIAQPIVKHFSPEIDLSIPTNKATWQALLALGIILFFGSFCYIEALTGDGSIFVVTSLMILSPIAAAVVKNLWTKSTPNMYQIAAFIVAAIAVILMAKGNSIQPLTKP